MTSVLSSPHQTVPPFAHRIPGPSAPPERWEREARTTQIVEALRVCTVAAEEAELREQLIEVNMPMATALARRYRNRGESEEDLEQVAFLALTQAARRFDASAGTPFAAFCVPTVLGELRRHFRDRGWVVRPPRGLQELQLLVLRAQNELTARLNRTPTVAEIASHVGRDFDHVEEALALTTCYTPASLNRPATHEADAPYLGDLLPAGDDQHSASEARVLLAPAVRELSERDRRILHLRFFGGMTQREIAEDIGVTQMQVSRVLSRIFSDLREAIGAPD